MTFLITLVAFVGFILYVKGALREAKADNEKLRSQLEFEKDRVSRLTMRFGELIRFLASKSGTADIRSALASKETAAPENEEKKAAPPVAPAAQIVPPIIKKEAPATATPLPLKPPSKPLPKFEMPTIDWEQFMGVKLFAWVGGFALFLGAAFFVKYSIDHGWITPLMRVCMGFVLGAGCIAGGLRLRSKNVAVTVQALCASGISILYADVFAAHSFYQFIGTVPTFLLMIVVTTLAFLLAVRLDSKFVAYLGLVGGFLTPPLLSTGVDNPLGLFGYIAVLDIGVAAIAIRQKWGPLATAAGIGTVMMEFGWVFKFFEPAKVYTGGGVFLLFAAMFGGIYLLALNRKMDSKWFEYPASFVPLFAVVFTFFMLNHSALGARPDLVLTYLIVVNVLMAALLFKSNQLDTAYFTAGVFSFLLLLRWSLQYMTLELLPWGLAYDFLFAVLHAICPALLRRPQNDNRSLFLGRLSPLAMILLIMFSLLRETANSFLIWPFIFLLDAVAIFAGVVLAATWVVVGALVLTMVVGLVWITTLPSAAGLPGILAIVTLFSAGFFAISLVIDRLPFKKFFSPRQPSVSDDLFSGIQISVVAVTLPFVLLSVAAAQFALPNPSMVFACALAMDILLLALARYRGVDVGSVVGLVGSIFVEYVWYVKNFEPALFGVFFPWAIGFFGLFFITPTVLQRKKKDSPFLWMVSAAAGPASFYLVWQCVEKTVGAGFIGIVPALFAALYLLMVMHAVKSISEDSADRTTIIAALTGVLLLFISLIFPLQFSKQWITIGWALEGAALIWLYRRLPHNGLKAWATALLLISFARLALNPAVLAYHERTGVPIFNWYFYTYGIVTACLMIAAWLWRPQDELQFGIKPGSLFNALGTILLFLLVNIEIADYFSSGPTLIFQFSGNLAQDMTTSLAWAVFAFSLLVAGIRLSNKSARYASLALLVVTIMKLFFHDLWRLGQLYRVGSLIGLAATLILVSFLYQRYVAEKPKGVTNAK